MTGGLVGYAIFFLLAWLGDRLNRPLMGMGDVKLSGALGLWLGLAPLLLALYLGVLLGGAVAL
ncbi:MAG: prepilin peptidase, partial [Chloroflexota bacterium]